MSIAIASILQEANTFSPVMTRYEDFTPVFGPAALERHRGKMTEMGGFIEVLTKGRRQIAPVCAAWAITANRLRQADFERLVNNFRSHLAAAGKPEGLLLAMHGAQTAEGVDDVQGHVLGCAREILGPNIPIVLTLDLHANVTRAMVERATAIVGYHTYPHIAMYEVGQNAAKLLFKTLAGKIRPAMAWRKLPLMVNARGGAAPPPAQPAGVSSCGPSTAQPGTFMISQRETSQRLIGWIRAPIDRAESIARAAGIPRSGLVQDTLS